MSCRSEHHRVSSKRGAQPRFRVTPEYISENGQPSIESIQYGGRLSMLQRYRVNQEMKGLDDEQEIVGEMVWQQR
eukprot:1431342-Rhodomonas_salina.3